MAILTLFEKQRKIISTISNDIERLFHKIARANESRKNGLPPYRYVEHIRFVAIDIICNLETNNELNSIEEQATDCSAEVKAISDKLNLILTMVDHLDQKMPPRGRL